MRIHSLKIKGLRRIRDAEFAFGDATFLIGENNSGKSTVFAALEYLLSGAEKAEPGDYYSEKDAATGITERKVDEIVLEAEFVNLPMSAKEWRGFKGRVFQNDPIRKNDSGLSVVYRKTYPFGQRVKVELKSIEREINASFSTCKTGQDYVDAGLQENKVRELFPDLNKAIGRSQGAREKLELLDDIWDVGTEEVWFENPGGIPGNVLKRLPRYLLIPANTSESEIEGSSSGVLARTLKELFKDVRQASDNYRNAQKYLDLLSGELDPEDSESEFGKMMSELNEILSGVFPESKLHAKTDLSEPDQALKPVFTVEMSSNVRTAVRLQGSGMVRAAAFGMLRYRQRWLAKREDEQSRPLIICFEEPEIYLHPRAANQMRDTIYELSGVGSQIVATTHSPFLIDLARKPRQVLNNMCISLNGVRNVPFNVSEAYESLTGDDKQYVKMLLRIDDHIARVFFTKNVVIIEGDTEEILISESIKRLPKSKYLKLISDHEVVKARGKASIIGLVKYLLAMGIEPTVVHDRDAGVAGAEKFNSPIKVALEGRGKIVQMHENVEDEVGYSPPSSEKPYKAFSVTTEWGDEWTDIPNGWRSKLGEIFGDYVSL